MLPLLTTGATLGALHALEVDHVVAVTAFVGSEPRAARAAGFGFRWGLGHAGAVFVVGTVLVALDLEVPADGVRWLEGAMGVVLIAIGAWAWRASGHLHIHAPVQHGDHGHLHSHRGDLLHHSHGHGAGETRMHHRHITTIVGAMHGVAGLAPIIALVPIALVPSPAAQLLYLAAFGLGTVLGMGTFGALAAVAIRQLGATTPRIRTVARVAASAAVVVGVWWLSAAASWPS